MRGYGGKARGARVSSLQSPMVPMIIASAFPVISSAPGSRTVTVFAPVDEAFRGRRGSGDHGGGSVTDGLFRADSRLGKRDRRRAADRFVLSHVVLAGPGDPPMYTAGLRFYQVRDTAYRLPVNGNEYGENDDDDSDGTTAASAEDAGGNSAASRPAPDGESPRYYQLTVYKDSGESFCDSGSFFLQL